MDAMNALAERLPEQAWNLRRLQMRDPTFRAICEDYGDAMGALEHWQRAGDQKRVEEYRRLADELLDEALAVVAAHGER